ncbi:MAG TPA: hypothetical protein DIW81_13110 [Planctomycetaceae bacterium]|nr:hypothetical protein [Rubinisphaera sp.]HCS52510.1 hypothetical protein [Planctomycetaceae bacterium]
MCAEVTSVIFCAKIVENESAFCFHLGECESLSEAPFVETAALSECSLKLPMGLQERNCCCFKVRYP